MRLLGKCAKHIRLAVLVLLPSFVFADTTHLVDDDTTKIIVAAPEYVKPDTTIALNLFIEYFGESSTSLYVDSLDVQISNGETYTEDLGYTLDSVKPYLIERDKIGEEMQSLLADETLDRVGAEEVLDRFTAIEAKLEETRKSVIIRIPVGPGQGELDLDVSVNYHIKYTLKQGAQSAFAKETPRSSTGRVSATSTTQTKPTGAFIFIIDALGRDFMLANIDELPNIERYFIDTGLSVTDGVNIFPTVTIPNHASIMTGAYPEDHGIPAMEWMDRAGIQYGLIPTIEHAPRLRFWPPDIFIGDPPNDYIQIETVFEEAKQSGVVQGSYYSAMEQVYDKDGDDGIHSTNILTKGRIALEHRLGNYIKGDNLTRDDALGHIGLGYYPGVHVLWLIGEDYARHEAPYSNTSIDVLKNVDAIVGEVMQAFKNRGIYDQTVFVFTADHGTTEISQGYIVNDLTKAIKNSSYFNTSNVYNGTNHVIGNKYDLVIRYNAEVVHIYVKDDSNDWAVLPDENDARVDAAVTEIKKYATTSGSIDEIFVRTASGYVIAPGGDFGTPYTDYPNAQERLDGLFLDRSGDIIITAKEDYSIWHGSWTCTGDHGSLRPDDSYVPIMFHGPGIAQDTLTSARTIDIAPTVAGLLGFTMPDAKGSVLPVQYLPLPGYLDGFVRNNEYFQTTVDVGNIPKLVLDVNWEPYNNNDLDLKVVSPSETVYGIGGITEEDGFTYTEYCDGGVCWSEKMIFNAPEQGQWTVKVYGASVSGTPDYQTFTLSSDILPADEAGPGGIDFTAAGLNYISACSDTSSGISFVMKGEEGEAGDPIIDIGSKTGMSINTFLAGLAIQDHKQWISMDPPDPYDWSADKGRVRIDPEFAKTDAGRIFLDADVKMKKIFASKEIEEDMEDSYWKWDDMINGKSYYGKLKSSLGNWYYPSPLMRAFIIPDNLTATGDGCKVFITSATLGLEFTVDSVFFTFPSSLTPADKADLEARLEEWRLYFINKTYYNTVPAKIYRINNDPEFENLRSLYVSLAIAQWYKNQDRSTIPFGDIIDSNNVSGFESATPLDMAYWEDRAWDPLGDMWLDLPSGRIKRSFRGGVMLSASDPDITAELSDEQEALVEEVATSLYVRGCCLTPLFYHLKIISSVKSHI